MGNRFCHIRRRRWRPTGGSTGSSPDTDEALSTTPDVPGHGRIHAGPITEEARIDYRPPIDTRGGLAGVATRMERLATVLTMPGLSAVASMERAV
jgi:hypothetical protein